MLDNKPSIDKQAFRGGMSDLKTLMSEESYYYGQNIETQENEEYITLARKPADGFDTNGNLGLSATEGRNTGVTTDTFFGCQNGQIYADNGNLVGTLASNDDIYNMARFDDHILMFYESSLGVCRIDRIDVASAGTSVGSWTGSITANAYSAVGFSTANIPNFNRYFVYEIVDRYLFFTCGNTIGRIEAGSTVVQKADIDFEDNVVGITRHGPLFRVTLSNGKIYFWDGFASFAEAAVNMKNYIRRVSNQGKIDYIATGGFPWYGQLYAAGGYERQLLKESLGDRVYNIPKNQFTTQNPGGNNITVSYGNILYIPQIVDTLAGSGDAIASYGFKYEGFPVAHNIICNEDFNGDIIDRIGLLYTPLNSGQFLYYSSVDVNGDASINYINLSNDVFSPAQEYIGEGYVMTQKYNMGIKDWVKTTVEINSRVEIPQDTEIEIEYDVDGSGTFTSIGTFDSADVDNGRLRITSLQMSVSFSEIMRRIKLRTSDSTRTPKLYNFRFSFDPIDG